MAHSPLSLRAAALKHLVKKKLVEAQWETNIAVLTTRCNNILIIVPWDWPLNHHPLSFYKRQ
jgi:hypothetical protein